MKNDGWIYGIKAIAELLGKDESTVRRWLRLGSVDVPVVKVGGRYRAVRRDLAAWAGLDV